MKPMEQKAFFMQNAIEDAKSVIDFLGARHVQLSTSSRCGAEAKQLMVAIKAIERFVEKYDKPAANPVAVSAE